MPFFITCKHCGRRFESKYSQKLFCTMACYRNSPQFQRMLRENAKRIAEAKRAEAQNGDSTRRTVQCLNCRKEMFTMPSRAVHKYCSSKCYREYMVGRFDRFIASPESLALPQNYDEFLSGDELHCLIEGCGWSGLALSSHMNYAHGIPKEKFKELAGFNAGTGVVTAAYAERLSELRLASGFNAEHMERLRSMASRPAVYKGAASSRRLEGKEHAAKGNALRVKPERTIICRGCGCTVITVEVARLYCSDACRGRYYQRENKKEQYPLRCTICTTVFNGNVEQKRRSDRGLKVVCRRIHTPGYIPTTPAST